MAIITAREFNHDVSSAKRAAADEPLIITDRGRPSYVLLTYDEYSRLTGELPNVVEALRQDLRGDFDFEFPRALLGAREVDL
jgi:PHD/YefM family antitoxin component YafN of YafNO toxin-antitoxin module